MPLLSVITSSSIQNFQYAKITAASFKTVSTRGQVTITNISGNFKSYNILNNGITIASNQTSSSYTITGLGDNVQIGPITIVPNSNNSKGPSYTVTGGSGSGKIYTMAYISNITFTNKGAKSVTLNYSGSYTGNLTITYTGGTASPASGFTTTGITYNMTNMTSNGVVYNFSVNCVNGDNIAGNTGTGSYTTFPNYTYSQTNATVTVPTGYNVFSFTNTAGGSININCYTSSLTIHYLIIGGGASGGASTTGTSNGGGGAGALNYGSFTISNGSYSYTIAVGSGGSGVVNAVGAVGNPSSITGSANYTAGGGYGGGNWTSPAATNVTTTNGGSGGGASGNPTTPAGSVGTKNANTYFNAGGGGTRVNISVKYGGGGGGAGGAGATGVSSNGAGGAGLTYSNLTGYNTGINSVVTGKVLASGGGGSGTTGSGGPGGSGNTNSGGTSGSYPNGGTSSVYGCGGGAAAGGTSGSGANGIVVLAISSTL